MWVQRSQTFSDNNNRLLLKLKMKTTPKMKLNNEDNLKNKDNIKNVDNIRIKKKQSLTDYDCFQVCFLRYNLMVDCFNSPAATYNGPEWQVVMDVLARYLAVINSSINFIIYCVAGKQFRYVLLNLLHLRSERNNSAEVSISVSSA